MKLLAKFNLILLVIFGAGALLISHFAYAFLIGNARAQVLREAQLMLASARSVRDFVAKDVSPLIQENPRHMVSFLPETVPFFGATATFNNLRKSYPEYTYKEAALNPTNLEDRAADWESDIIHHLRDRNGEGQDSGVRETPNGPALFVADPIRVTRDCMQCHGAASAAPPALLAVYGSNNGFGWRENEIVGAQIVSVPMSVPVTIAHQAYQRLMLFLGLTILLAMIALDAGVYWFVIRPLRVVSDAADRVSRGEKNVPPIHVGGEVGGKDEISVVAASFNRMQVSLAKALRIISEE
jgi:methyl-accepting chemotaxis protein